MPRSISTRILLGLAVVSLLAAGGALLGWRGRSGDSADSKRTAEARTRNTAPVSRRTAPSRVGASQMEVASTTPRQRALALSLESIETETDTEQRDALLERFVAGLTAADFPEALALLQAGDRSAWHSIVLIQLIRRWAGENPRAAAAWVAAEAGSEIRRDMVKAVALVWAGENLTEAFAWVRELPGGGERDGGLTTLAYEMAREDPVRALAVALELPGNAVREDLIQHASIQLAATDPDVAAWWANQITDSPLRQRVLANIASIWGESDPVAAAALAVKALDRGKPMDDAVVGIAQRWVQKKPEEAAAWAASFPPGSLRDTTLENVVKLWADQDVQAAGRWLNSLEAGPGRDAAVVAYLGKIAGPFPDAARQWVDTIEDRALRLRQIESVVVR